MATRSQGQEEPRVRIRTAEPPDAAAICDLHVAAVRTVCAPFYDQRVIDGWLRGRNAEGYLRGIESGAIFVAQLDDVIVGWGEAHPGVVDAVFVDPKKVRLGIGTLLLKHALETAASAGGSVTIDSTLNAVPFYERFGFKVVRYTVQRRNDVDIPIAAMACAAR